MTSGQLVGLVLAAGAGRRMGQPKALVREDGQTWLARTVAALREGGVEEVRVVVGSGGDAVRSAVPPGCTAVESARWAEGMGESLRAGLTALLDTDANADAVVVMLVDTPGVGAEVVRRMSLSASPAVLARAAYGGTPGHPVVIGRDHWHGVLAACEADAGARHYLRREGTTLMECGDLGSGLDVDTPEALGQWLTRERPDQLTSRSCAPEPRRTPQGER